MTIDIIDPTLIPGVGRAELQRIGDPGQDDGGRGALASVVLGRGVVPTPGDKIGPVVVTLVGYPPVSPAPGVPAV